MNSVLPLHRPVTAITGVRKDSAPTSLGLLVCALALLLLCPMARAQVDPTKRELFQFGYNAAFQGHPPQAAYAFYYRNEPEFLRTNWTLRLAVAPTYLDSELGIRGVLGENTDLGIGLAGGAFADNYNEIRHGTYLPKESFDGYGGETSISLYHCFNPGQRIPLNGVLRGVAHFMTYDETKDTAANFTVPDDMESFKIRAGLRWGGREPILFPALAMELSVWYMGEFRTKADTYGYNDRSIESQSHLFWGEALLAYQMPELHHSFYLSLTAATSLGADRLSCYRLGALLPMSSEYPLSLPGYYYQELSARQLILLGGNYIVPLEKSRRWNLALNGSTAVVDYLPGLEQPGNWHAGIGLGLFYTSPSWRVMVGYGYGIEAIRSDGRGAHSIGFLLQLDLSHAREAFYRPEQTGSWRSLQRILGVLGS